MALHMHTCTHNHAATQTKSHCDKLTLEANAIPAMEQMRLHQHPQMTRKIVSTMANVIAPDP